MTALFDWPEAAALVSGRVVPKARIYEHSKANAAIKRIFVQEVDQILWTHKLAPETINLNATEAVSEIQVFRIVLRVSSPSRGVLRAIDRAVHYPLIFELGHADRVQVVASHKRPDQSGRARQVVGSYFASDWLPEDAPRAPLPLALDMEGLYGRLLTSLVAGQIERWMADLQSASAARLNDETTAPSTELSTSDVPLAQRVARADAIRIKAREVERMEARLAREKQFNKRVEVNAGLRTAKRELMRMAEDFHAGGAAPGD